MPARRWPNATVVLTPACFAVLLALAAGPGSSRAHAEGVHPELGLALSGLVGLGEFATVSSIGVGGDGALHVVRIYRGLGVRAALGYQRLQGYEIPTGETIYNGIGTQEGVFRATQHFYWTAIGPEWRAPLGGSHLDLYLMFGRADVRADYSQGWLATLGDAPGSTRVSLVVAGATWFPAGSSAELGIEAFSGGSAAFWADPPAVVDGAGNHVLQSTNASITGIMVRLGYRFWYPRPHS